MAVKGCGDASMAYLGLKRLRGASAAVWTTANKGRTS